MQALMSGHLCGIYLVTAILLGNQTPNKIPKFQSLRPVENVTVTFLGTTFMAFVLMIYELRFLGLMYRVQRPERPTRRTPPTPLPLRRLGNGTPQNTPATTAWNTPAPNTPATATVLPTPEDGPTRTTSPAFPIARPPVMEEVWEPNTQNDYLIIAKYFYVSVLSLFILTSWLSTHRVLMNLLLLALHSFWVPQIYRNVMRGVRKALGWRYVIGMTVSRGGMAAWLIWCQTGDYVFLWESEEGDGLWGWIVLGWLWVQVVVLFAQEIFGPRFFISSNVPQTKRFWSGGLIVVAAADV
jgi:transmembrane E3 ubiquitin-protein ligase